MAFDEKSRLAALAQYKIVDTGSEQIFDEIARFTAELCEAPIALISFVEERRQWFKAHIGFDVSETPREQSFCVYCMTENDILEIPDATKDPRFIDNPLVTDEPHIRFYAGFALRAPGGEALGSLCVIDRKPRAGLTELQRSGVRVLANQVMAQLELKRALVEGRSREAHMARMAEEKELITQELSHRIKNIFSVVSGLIGLSGRAQPQAKASFDQLRGRVMALGRAHDFVRPHGAASQPAGVMNTLHGLLGELFAPYQRSDISRLVITGDDIALDDRSATPLALLFHELATNATKYGALSRDEGQVLCACRREEDDFTIRWTETGGPPALTPQHAGFGTRVTQMSVEAQLGGLIERDWMAEGLIVTAKIPVASFSREFARRP